MIVACNNNIKEVQYSGFTISEIYACGGQLVWEKEPTPPITHCDQYLTFVAIDNCTFTFLLANSGYSYSLDSGATWSSISGGGSLNVNAGDKVYWKRYVPTSGKTGTMLNYLSSTGRFEIEGNIMSIVDSDDFSGKTDLTRRAYGLFEELFTFVSGITSAENLCLPATTLSSGCYRRMFYNCDNLVTPPKVLPASVLVSQCYEDMFSHCSGMTTAPDILATSFKSGTNASISCCNQMFQNCKSLTKSPRIGIREDITTTQALSQFNGMFLGCDNLNEIYCLIDGNIGTSYTNDWVQGVASSGTFYKNANATWISGDDGIPNGWTVVDI